MFLSSLMLAQVMPSLPAVSVASTTGESASNQTNALSFLQVRELPTKLLRPGGKRTAARATALHWAQLQ